VVRGLGLLLAVLALALAGAPGEAQAAIRHYWVAAVPVHWTIAPNGRDAINGVRYDDAKMPFETVAYRAYTRNWERQLPHRYGIQGPLIRARVGDKILVHFKNLDNLFEQPHSMHFHGVHYPFGADGSFIPGISTRGANVKPGDTFTYRLVAGKDSAGVWPYHDHSPSMMDSIAGGLYGALSILGRHERRPDREFVVFLAAMNEFMTIDGRAFVGNTPLFESRVGDLVQWDVLTLGEDFHTFHVHGHRWQQPGGGGFVDVQTLGPAESYRIRWREDRPGTWLYHCHVESHMEHGMIGLYKVRR
jgi:FtsP/CotA-like multicopper oxidase with cupredoxin domain